MPEGMIKNSGTHLLMTDVENRRQAGLAYLRSKKLRGRAIARFETFGHSRVIMPGKPLQDYHSSFIVVFISNKIVYRV